MEKYISETCVYMYKPHIHYMYIVIFETNVVLRMG